MSWKYTSSFILCLDKHVMERALPLHFQIRVEGKLWDHVTNYVPDYATPNRIIHAANTSSEYSSNNSYQAQRLGLNLFF
jgi:hypothetical protein